MKVGDLFKYRGTGPWTNFSTNDLFLIIHEDTFCDGFELMCQTQLATGNLYLNSPEIYTHFDFVSNHKNLANMIPRIPYQQLPLGMQFVTEYKATYLPDIVKEKKCDCGTHKTYGYDVDITFHSDYCDLLSKK